MSESLGIRDLTFGRLGLPTLTDEVQEAVGDALSSDNTGVAVARRRPRQFTLTIPLYGTYGDADPFGVGKRMRRQMRSMMENSTYRLQGLYMALGFDTELNGWMLGGSGEIKYAEGGVTLAQFAFELDTAYRIGTIRSHRPARRVEMVDRRLASIPQDYRETIYGTDFVGTTALKLSYLPVNIYDTMGYNRQPVVVYARNGLDGPGYIAEGMQHANILDFERNEPDFNKGDVVIYDPRGVSGLPEDSGGTNLCATPNFERASIGLGSWSAAATGLGAGATVSRSTEASFDGEASAKVITTNSVAKEGIGTQLLGTFKQGVAYSLGMWVKGNAGGEKITLTMGVLGTDSAQTNATLTTSWTRITVAWTPSAERAAAFALLYTQAASVATFFLDEVMAIEGATNTEEFDGDSKGWSWVGGSALAGNAASTRDPQTVFGWEEVYGPEQPLTSGECVVMQNQLCRVRYVAATTTFAIDKWSSTEVWTEVGRVAVYETTATDTYTQCAYAIPRADGSLATVLEYTPERGVIRLSLQRSSTVSTTRVDLYITLQRGWTAPRLEAYANAPAFPAAGVQMRLTLNTGANAVLMGGPWTTKTLIPSDEGSEWSITPGLLFGTELTVPWVATAPIAGGTVVSVGTNQALARLGLYTDSAAYGSSKPSLAMTSRYNETQVTGQTIYGYATMNLGMTQTAQPNVLWNGTAHKVGGTEVADAAASNGKALQVTGTTSTKVTEIASGLPLAGTYGIWVRARVGGGTGTITATIEGTNTTIAPTLTTTTYKWFYCGLGTGATNSAVAVFIAGAAAQTILLDRVVLIMVQNRKEGVVTTPTFDGAADLAVQHLYDSRTVPELVERT